MTKRNLQAKPRRYSDIVCARCEKTVRATGSTQKLCEECRPTIRKQAMSARMRKKYYENLEEMRLRNRERYREKTSDPAFREMNRKRVAEYIATQEGKVAVRGYKLRKYGTTIEEIERLTMMQNRRCAICELHESKAPHRSGKSKEKRFGLVIDHCHDEVRVRGLLCVSCNSALGHFRDDPLLVARGVEYLLDPPIRRLPSKPHIHAPILVA